jgi:peptidoglycan hydrolase CwlO-like protein
MTQQEIDQVVSAINEANLQLRVAQDKLDTQERIIKTQEEMIEILKATIINRDKFIAILEGQLGVLDRVVDRQILKG